MPDTSADNPPDNDDGHTDRTFLAGPATDQPPRLRPGVHTRPVGGRQGLFVDEGSTVRIVEPHLAESHAVRCQMFAHIAKPECTARWLRVTHRAAIMGDAPFHRAAS